MTDKTQQALEAKLDNALNELRKSRTAANASTYHGRCITEDKQKTVDDLRKQLAALQSQPEALKVLYPEQWAQCSPEWINQFPIDCDACAKAPRVWSEAAKNHLHPKDWQPNQSARMAELEKESAQLAKIRAAWEIYDATDGLIDDKSDLIDELDNIFAQPER